MHHHEPNERVSQSNFTDLCGACGGAFLIIGGMLSVYQNRDWSYLVTGGGFMISSYFLYEYTRSGQAVKIELPIESANTGQKNVTKKILPPIKTRPIDLVMKKIINGEQKRHQRKKITWLELIKQVLTLPLLRLNSNKKNDETKILPVENIYYEVKKIEKKLKRDIQIIKHSESIKPATTTNFISDSLPTKSKRNAPQKSLQKKKVKPIINSDPLKTVVVEMKHLEPICDERDKQKKLIQKLQIEKNHLEQQLKDGLELIAQRDKDIVESQKRNKELAELILREQKFSAETAQGYLLLEKNLKNHNQLLLEWIEKLNGNQPRLVKYTHEIDSGQEPSSFPPTMPLLNPAGLFIKREKNKKDKDRPGTRVSDHFPTILNNPMTPTI